MAQSKEKRVLKVARDAARDSKDWVIVHNALFGLGGKCTELFPTQSDRTAFAQTEEFAEIMQILEKLQKKSKDPGFTSSLSRANGAMTVRLPRSMHAALLAEAKAEDVSLNQLCMAKLAVQLRAVTPL
jgi:predicted HicB family RNase H-like nuclease